MAKKKVIIVDSSYIIRQGIGAMISTHSYEYELIDVANFNMLSGIIKTESPSLIIINPAVLVDHSGEQLRQLRQLAINCGFKLMALVYAYYDEGILSLFDDVIYINDDETKVLTKMRILLDICHKPVQKEENASLSQRELDVIRLIAMGYSNREIAEKLHISIHTVISHRKNITAKLGIKSASGLTIYAVINKLISSTDFDKTI